MECPAVASAFVSGSARTAWAETTSHTLTTRRMSGAAWRAARVRARSAGDVDVGVWEVMAPGYLLLGRVLRRRVRRWCPMPGRKLVLLHDQRLPRRPASSREPAGGAQGEPRGRGYGEDERPGPHGGAVGQRGGLKVGAGGDRDAHEQHAGGKDEQQHQHG